MRGERLSATAPRALKAPDGVAGYWGDGDSIDAGSAMILENNLAHYAAEAPRHLAWSEGPGFLSLQGTGWSGLVDRSNDLTTLGAHAISWDRRVAFRDGPFDIIADHLLGDGRETIRPIRVCAEVELGGASGSLIVYVALTTTPAPPVDGYIAFDSQSITTAGAQVVRKTLVAAGPVPPSESWESEPGGGTGASTRPVCPVWIWWGWKNTAGGLVNAVHSLSAFEVREVP